MKKDIRFDMIESKNTMINSNLLKNDNIDNKIIEDIFEQHNIPNEYRKFIFTFGNFGQFNELLTDTSMQLQNNIEILKDGTNKFTAHTVTNPNTFIVKADPFKIKVKKEDIIKFFKDMKEKELLDNYIKAINYIFNQAIYMPLNDDKLDKNEKTYSYVMRQLLD